MDAHQSTTYLHVLAQAEHLAPTDKLRLLEALAAQVRKDIAPTKHYRVTEFRGMDTVSWAGTDAQEYVNRERDAWDG